MNKCGKRKWVKELLDIVICTTISMQLHYMSAILLTLIFFFTIFVICFFLPHFYRHL